MKTIYNKIASVALGAALAGSLASCVSENPFSNDGEGLVKMSVSVNTAVTRATPSNSQELLDKCVIYVNNDKGLLHKWTGASNIPSELYMRYGSYTAEAWSGDSVSAAYESEGKKYYKGLEKFTVDAQNSSVQVNIKCTIANVVGSVDESTIDNNEVKDMKVTFSTTKGSLSLDSSNWADKAYFMMASTDMTADGNILNYLVEGKDIEGKSFSKSGVIKNVKSGHDYRLKFEYDPAQPTDGGAFIQILIDDTEVLVAGDSHIYGKPAFLWEEEGMDVGDQIVGTPGEFGTYDLRVAAYSGFNSVTVTPVVEAMFDGVLPSVNGSHAFELSYINEPDHKYSDALHELGIDIQYIDTEYDKDADAYICKYTLVLGDKWLNSLPESNEPYELTVRAVDARGAANETVISIANTTAAIAKSAPVNVDAAALAKDFTAVGSKSVTLPLTFDDGADLTNAAIQYREVGVSEWNTQTINISRAAVTASVKLTNLSPSTEYEYRTVGGEIIDGEYELKSKVATFTTESVFIIPNASMEEWSNFSENAKVLLPAAGGVRTFWDSGNHGSATLSKTLTQSNSDIKHSGNVSAELKSQFVGLGIIGKFAAGNLFAGTYVGTDGTDGILEFGREYDGSHPTSLSVWANYRPGIADSKGANDSYLKQGEKDKAQIYVALSTKPIEIKTKNSQKLFNANDNEILAYGEVTLSDDFGPDGQMQQINIPLNYYDRAKTTEAKYLIIVCSASIYGDYFCGGEGSVMYLDDFELVYE